MVLGASSFVLSAFVFWSSWAFATVEMVGISDHFKTKKTISAAQIDVYSGRTAQACVGDGSSPCDSCSALAGTFGALGAPGGAYNLSCNEREIYPTLTFSITLRSSLPAAYIGPVPYCQSVIVAIAPGVSTPFPSESATVYSTNGSLGAANQAVTATFKWQTICANSAGTDPNCTKSFRSRWSFGFVKTCGQTSVDSAQFNDTLYAVEFRHRFVQNSPPMTMFANNPCNADTASGYENICHFQMFPGDEKAFIQILRSTNASSLVVPAMETTAGSNPLASDDSGMKYLGLRALWIEGANNFGNIPLNTSNRKDFTVDGTTISDGGRITGLTNGVSYSFILANMDEGGNFTHFSTPGALTTPGGGPENSGAGVVLSGLDDGNGQAATPQPVFGLLDGKNCFVATAAYGSGMAPQVEMLREFRGRYLLPNSIGKSWVSFYYQHSPRFADWIAKSEWRRAIARALLAPVIWLAELTMASGLGAWAGFLIFVTGTLGLSLIGVGVVAWSIVRLRSLSGSLRKI